MPDVPPTHLEIKDWARHQHYKDRRPPWIKLYGALLDDAKFLALPEPAQAQLIKLWVLASRMGHPLPNDPRLLAGKIVTKRLLLEPLIASGFLIPCSPAASAALAEPEQNARPLRTENRQQQRTEVEREKPVVVGAVIGEPADYALQITIAANRAVTAKWGEQIHPYLHGQSYEITQALQDVGVPLDVAQASIRDQCEKSQRTGPPKGINWFRPGILTHHATLTQKALDASAPAPAPAGDALDRWLQQEKAKEKSA